MLLYLLCRYTVGWKMITLTPNGQLGSTPAITDMMDTQVMITLQLVMEARFKKTITAPNSK